VSNIEGETPAVDLKASSDKLAINELAKLFPRLRGYNVQPAFDLVAKGPTEAIAVALSLQDATLGDIKADLTVHASTPGWRTRGTARVDRLNVQALVRNGSPRLASNITGDTRFDLTLPEGRQPLRGSYAVDIDRVRFAGYDARHVVGSGRIDGRTVHVNARGDAYGGHATAVGTVKAGAPITLDVRGRASNVDLRNLPPMLRAPKAASNLQFGYTLSVRGSAFKGDVALDQSMLAGATIAPGATGTFSFGAGSPTYTARGEIAGVDVQRVGREFNIPTLATDRYQSSVSGTFDMAGAGGGSYPLTLDVTGTMVDSQLFGAPSRAWTYDAPGQTGNVAGAHAWERSWALDPAVVTGDSAGCRDR
jgi:hypothetical protein